MWASFKLNFSSLKFLAWITEDEQPAMLHQVLTIRRLQALEFLHLGCPINFALFNYARLAKYLGLLQNVLDDCPRLQKLSLDFGVWWHNADHPGLTGKLARVAAMLVKFQEIDLTGGSLWMVRRRSCLNKEARAILAAILTALSGEGSRLRVLTLPGDEEEHASVLAGVRGEGVTVNMSPDDESLGY